MSMGQSKTERFKDQYGNTLVNRTPVKVLNPFVKANLLLTLKRDDVFATWFRSPGSDMYYVKDASGKQLFTFDNAWDYGYYIIQAGDKVLAEMDWFEDDGHTNKEQQDIFDVLKAVMDKFEETERIEEGRRNLTQDEAQALQSMGINLGRSM